MTSITKHTNSLKKYAYSILGAHICLLFYFYTVQMIYIIFVPGTFFVLYKWVELVYQIEQSNRENLLMLISSTENENTRKLLLQELWYADLNSLGGEPLNDIRQ